MLIQVQALILLREKVNLIVEIAKTTVFFKNYLRLMSSIFLVSSELQAVTSAGCQAKLPGPKAPFSFTGVSGRLAYRGMRQSFESKSTRKDCDMSVHPRITLF